MCSICYLRKITLVVAGGMEDRLAVRRMARRQRWEYGPHSPVMYWTPVIKTTQSELTR